MVLLSIKKGLVTKRFLLSIIAAPTLANIIAGTSFIGFHFFYAQFAH